MELKVKGFDWDNHNLKKLIKYKVTQEEAEEIFYTRPLVDEGAYEKKGERRFRCLSVTKNTRYLAAFFTVRKELIRNISVRPMRQKEKRHYEKTKKI